MTIHPSRPAYGGDKILIATAPWALTVSILPPVYVVRTDAYVHKAFSGFLKQPYLRPVHPMAASKSTHSKIIT